MVTDMSDVPRNKEAPASRGSRHNSDTADNPSALMIEKVVTRMGRAGDNKPRAIPETRWRASMAGTCMRQNAYYVTETKKSDPLDSPDYYRMQLGTDMHTRLQMALVKENPKLEVEVGFDLRPFGINGSGSTDLDDEEGDRIIEIKTINGFGFKKLAAWKNPTGPRTGHVLQSGLAARALGRSSAVLIYLNQETISPNEADKNNLVPMERWMASFTIPIESIDTELDAETARLQAMFAMLDEQDDNGVPRNDPTFVPRYEPEMPPGARITEPKPAKGNAPWALIDEDGQYTQTGHTWRCNYCAWQTRCHNDVAVEIKRGEADDG